MMPQRWNATVAQTLITLSLKLPGVALLHVCARPAQPPHQVGPRLYMNDLTVSLFEISAVLGTSSFLLILVRQHHFRLNLWCFVNVVSNCNVSTAVVRIK